VKLSHINRSGLVFYTLYFALKIVHDLSRHP